MGTGPRARLGGDRGAARGAGVRGHRGCAGRGRVRRTGGQSRAHVVSPPRGAFVVFPTHHRPGAGTRGWHRAALRHGVSTVTRGSRTALGIIFHDAT
ncbi:MAG: 2OG-Fe(II) oxygenase [Actinobacteria bacterium]|nr:2OG-Fe(II) oxygenase [Actinomycetota bacterium]